MNTFSLESKHALVCGATQGIGKATAIAFARHGASVTVVGRNMDGLNMVLGELPRAGSQTHRTICVDFANWQAVRDAANNHVAAHGPVHILVNNTGGPKAGPAFEGTPEDYAAAFSQHLLCNQVLVQAVASGMRDANYGRIINIISTSVLTPIKNLGVSNTIRGAVANWARTLAAELAPFGITVNNILPGFTETARLMALLRGRAERAGSTLDDVRTDVMASIPARRLGSPDEIAAVAAFLASPAASYVNGVNLPVDGGRTAIQG